MSHEQDQWDRVLMAHGSLLIAHCYYAFVLAAASGFGGGGGAGRS